MGATGEDFTSPLVTGARSVAPVAADLGALGDAARRLEPAVVSALVRAGLLRALVPAALGGGEAPVPVFLEAVRTLAEADAATGWVVAVCGTSGMLAAYLDESDAAEIYGAPEAIVGGVFAPRGRARPDGATFEVSGRWPFASGCEHSSWLMGGCLVGQGDELRRLPSGAPDVLLVLAPAPDYEIHDTWHVAGLRATGSHDISLQASVPARRCASLLSGSPLQTGPLYAFPVFGLLALSIAAVGLGIASGAIADLIAIASQKRPTGSARTLAQRGATQAQVSRAQAGLDAARALMGETVAAAWSEAQERGEVAVVQRAALRRAATHAMETAAATVDAMYRLGGGSAVYESHPVQRRHRDMHVATQHMLVGAPTWELTGRLALGLETDASQL